MFQFYMPTKVIIGRECVVKEGHLLKGIGNKALIVTGRYSAKKNGALEDIIKTKISIFYWYYMYLLSC